MSEYLSDDQLKSKLRTILETWPLYRELAYEGAQAVQSLPQLISLYCTRCRKEQLWGHGGASGKDKYGFASAEYRCRNCATETVRFYFYWGPAENRSLFMKVGQYPPLEERILPELEKRLKAEDLDFYKKALRCRNFNYGLAALAYLRRVVENRMNDLLDLVAEAARESSFATAELQKLDQVKASKRFDDKVTYASGILPLHLRPGGSNPIDLLHDIASEGIHSKPDQECIDIFDRTRLVFEYVFRQLHVSASEARAFAQELKELAARRGQVS